MSAAHIPIMFHTDAYDPDGIWTAHPGEWYDLRSAEDVFIQVGETRLIDLGVSIQLPAGYEAILAPRSSTFKRYGIIQTNGIGVIDNSYCGPSDVWKMPVYCLVGTYPDGEELGSYIRKGDRICQFRIQSVQPPAIPYPVDSLHEQDRGGFGSTG